MGKKILVIDDEELVVKSLSKLNLKKMGIFFKFLNLILIFAFLSNQFVYGYEKEQSRRDMYNPKTQVFDLSPMLGGILRGAQSQKSNLNNLHLSYNFNPPILNSVSTNSQNESNYLTFLLSKNLFPLDNFKLREEAQALVRYFFIGISLPDDSFWVNLRPDGEDNIINDKLAQTDIGRILLETDLELKKNIAKFISPETTEGKEYWDKLYKKAGELFGYDNITIPTLTRFWIVPDEVIVREIQDNAYIYKATLKVMLEQDYLTNSSIYSFKDSRLKALNEYASQLIRELIIPKLTQEVNISKRYAPLRQVFNSLILAQWFKRKFKWQSGLYSWVIDKGLLDGLESKIPWSEQKIWRSYFYSYKNGEYRFQKFDYSIFGQIIKTYFSGGVDFNLGPNNSNGFKLSVINEIETSSNPATKEMIEGREELIPVIVKTEQIKTAQEVFAKAEIELGSPPQSIALTNAQNQLEISSQERKDGFPWKDNPTIKADKNGNVYGGGLPYLPRRTEDFIVSGNTRLHLDIYESARTDPVIIFLPGTGVYSEFYSEFMTVLNKAGYNVIGIDYRGHGHSSGKRGDFTFNELIEDIQHVISYAIERFNERIGMIGTSQGGVLALYVETIDSRIKSVVSHNAAILSRDAPKLARYPLLLVKYFSFFWDLLVKLFPNLYLPISSYIDPNKIFEEKIHLRQALSDPMVVKKYTLRAITSLKKAKPKKEISSIKTPTMFISGERDQVVPPYYSLLIFNELTCLKEFCLIPDAGHMLFVEYIPEVLPKITAWFDKTLRENLSSDDNQGRKKGGLPPSNRQEDRQISPKEEPRPLYPREIKGDSGFGGIDFRDIQMTPEK